MRTKLLVSLLIVVALGAAFFHFSSVVPISDEVIEKEYAAVHWPPVGYETVKAYVYNVKPPPPGFTDDPDILKNGKLASTVANKDGVTLSPDQAQRLIAAVSKIPPHHNGTFTVSTSACFDPHHAFVFYDSNNNPVATIEVCTLCQDVQLSPQRKLFYNHDFAVLESLFRELNLPFFHSQEELNSFRAESLNY